MQAGGPEGCSILLQNLLSILDGFLVLVVLKLILHVRFDIRNAASNILEARRTRILAELKRGMVPL